MSDTKSLMLVAAEQASFVIVDAAADPSARLASASPWFCTRSPKRRSRRWLAASGVRHRGTKHDEPDEDDDTTKSVETVDCR